MKLLAVNGSPRKNMNTAVLIEKTAEGAVSAGGEAETFHLYDLKYTGCISCFSCKRKDGKNYGKCAVNDGLSELLAKASVSDAIVIGSPVYLGGMNGMTRSFLERLIFPYLVYDEKGSTLFKKKIKTALIYTMGADEERMKQMGYDRSAGFIEMLMKVYFGSSDMLLVNDTYQFDDYSKYVSSRFDPEKKKIRKETIFQDDCRKAFELGKSLVTELQ